MVKKLLLHCTLLLSISVFGNVAHALTIKIGHNDTPYDAATAALVKVVFERSGYNVSETCLLYTSPSPRDRTRSRMPSSA